MPIVHILDDSCTYVRHSFLRYPNESKQIYGTLKGCFEAPSKKKPTYNVDCPEITPLTMMNSAQSVNKSKMNNSNPLIHPDSNSITRYCLGTKLQMDPKKESHKSPQCAFHNAGLANQGSLLKTMTQEALQNCRKFRTIQVRYQAHTTYSHDN